MSPQTPGSQQIAHAARVHDDGSAAVIATDASGTIMYWSAGAESLYGWTEAEAIGRNIVDLTPTNNTVDEALEIMEQLKRGETWSGDFILQHRDGRPIYGHVTDVPVLDQETVIGIVGISRRARRDSQP